VIGAFDREHVSGAGLLAGGVAYRFFLWLVPFGLLLAAVGSFWVRLSARSLEHTAKDFGLGGVAAHSATVAVEDGSRARWYLLLAGLVLVTWAGAAAVRALRVAAFIAWRLPPERLRRPLHASALFFALAVLGCVASTWTSWARHNLGGFGLVATIAVAFIYAGAALFGFFKLPRPADVGWRELLPGALLVGCGLTAVHVFTAYYLAGRLERAPDLYGTLGASTAVLLILFLIARLILSAMFLNGALHAHAEFRPRR
jgi:membrane protein